MRRSVILRGTLIVVLIVGVGIGIASWYTIGVAREYAQSVALAVATHDAKRAQELGFSEGSQARMTSWATDLFGSDITFTPSQIDARVVSWVPDTLWPLSYSVVTTVYDDRTPPHAHVVEFAVRVWPPGPEIEAFMTPPE